MNMRNMAAVFIVQYCRRLHRMVSTKGLQALVLCGPSGSGKSTLLKRLFEEYPDKFGFSVSHTTRKPRPGEEDGIHYHFTSIDNFKEAVEKGHFLEYANYSGNMYGTSKDAVNVVVQSGKLCVLDIEVQGVKQLKKTDLRAIYIFVTTPSVDVLEERLKSRQTETAESLKKRLDTAIIEIEYGETPGNFDLIVINDNIENAYSTFRDFIQKELQKSSINPANGES